MTDKFDFPTGGRPIVYVRRVDVAALPEAMRARAEGAETLYALHDANGAPLALFADRNAAFVLARRNDLMPVNVH